MKKWIIIYLVLFSSVLRAQMDNLNLSYFGPFGVEPGIKSSITFDLKEWEGKANKKEELIHKTLFAGPEIAFYNRSNNHSNFILSGVSGIRRDRDKAKYYFATSIGLGYMLNSEVISSTVDFSKEKLSRNRESRHYLLSSINYEIGRDINENVSCYLKGNLSYLYSKKRANSAILFMELGLTYHLSKSNGS